MYSIIFFALAPLGSAVEKPVQTGSRTVLWNDPNGRSKQTNKREVQLGVVILSVPEEGHSFIVDCVVSVHWLDGQHITDAAV